MVDIRSLVTDGVDGDDTNFFQKYLRTALPVITRNDSLTMNDTFTGPLLFDNYQLLTEQHIPSKETILNEGILSSSH